MRVRTSLCATCPFREGSPYEDLREYLTIASLKEGRICHSTGSGNAINEATGKPAAICRGSRDFQLGLFFAMGFLSEPTDEAWSKKCAELGIKPDTKRK